MGSVCLSLVAILTSRTFGRLHIHPTSGQPKDYPHFHLVYKDAKPGGGFPAYDANTVSSTGWHSDVTYEEQPPGLTTLFLYANPTSGGDTGYVSQVGAYDCYVFTTPLIGRGIQQALPDLSRVPRNPLGRPLGCRASRVQPPWQPRRSGQARTGGERPSARAPSSCDWTEGSFCQQAVLSPDCWSQDGRVRSDLEYALVRVLTVKDRDA